MPDSADNLIEVRDLSCHFFTEEGVVRSVDQSSFDLPRGKTLCIVGESGSGKSVTARALMGLTREPGKIVSGQMLYRPAPGVVPIDLAAERSGGQLYRSLRGAAFGMIFQEPMAALSPVHTIGTQLLEGVLTHEACSRAEARNRGIDALQRVGIPEPERRFDQYGFELSGGMRQRAMIAMALACRPALLIADEPTTALDVTTQANILDLIADLQAETGMTVMFITHDLGVVAEIADEVAVMYLGRVVERGDVDTIFHAPAHPYTEALLNAMPSVHARRGTRLPAIPGMVPHPFARPSGCGFHPRCHRFVDGLCNRREPEPVDLGAGHVARCLRLENSKDQKEAAE
ncbi:ABC transporter ATP-binding protein [Roseobacter sinensis]|uniref:ABC transporter ATP-binding protein n=1 Tax=Roseobacter sinensis TaxID=2931391 RepID=A0ABT3BGK7_9RHOB|nr:ABC transporter ATP-binding protein [Roseobacter sp. WL0113]MCV3272303.1 ABC transporter ATP-binding protein [Roseobacter sp. WL0113]